MRVLAAQFGDAWGEGGAGLLAVGGGAGEGVEGEACEEGDEDDRGGGCRDVSGEGVRAWVRRSRACVNTDMGVGPSAGVVVPVGMGAA